MWYEENVKLKDATIWKQQSNGSPNSEQIVENVVKTSEKKQGQCEENGYKDRNEQKESQTGTQIDTAKKYGGMEV